MAQSGTDWVPSPAQSKLLETAAESDLALSVSDLCKAADVPRRTFYNWLRDDTGFKFKWSNLWSEITLNHRVAVISALRDKAVGGDVPAIRTFFELDGLLRQRMEHSGPNGGPIRTENKPDLARLSTDELLQLETLLKKAEQGE